MKHETKAAIWTELSGRPLVHGSLADKFADVIEQAARREALEAQAKRIAELEADRDSWRDQCSKRVKDWHQEHERVKALEAKCALLAASLAQEEGRSAELEAKVAAAENATRFAGLVLAQHRNDGYPGDVDGDFLQDAALQTGMIEERTVSEPCGERCSCAEALSESEFPTVCYFNTEAGKAAIAAAITAEDARAEACNT